MFSDRSQQGKSVINLKRADSSRLLHETASTSKLSDFSTGLQSHPVAISRTKAGIRPQIDS